VLAQSCVHKHRQMLLAHAHEAVAVSNVHIAVEVSHVTGNILDSCTRTCTGQA
jgi:hypothetical protein